MTRTDAIGEERPRASALATVGKTLAVALLGRREVGDYAAPINATSHILWGDEAAEQDGFSPRYTLVGAVLNAGAMVGWAALQGLAFGRWARRDSPAWPVAAVAHAVDDHVVPERLTPGLEKRISPTA